MINIRKYVFYIRYGNYLSTKFKDKFLHSYSKYSNNNGFNINSSRFKGIIRYSHNFGNKLTPELLTKEDIKRIRNIGLIAHVDAGKTTTTERMLYYSGSSRFMGEVDHGDTVTDYMEQERERGITITSAAVTFNWKNFKINLIDTPGHIDFTMEVERALCSLDGAVIILDASAGVQAQTLTVCHQADRYSVPRIAYLNKTDKPKSDINMCLDSIKSKLRVQPLLLHYPLYKEGVFLGIVDLVSLKSVLWNPLDQTQGRAFQVNTVTESNDKELWLKVTKERRLLIESAADLDDDIAEYVLSHDNYDNLDASTLMAGLRRITLKQKGLILFCGSSFKNVGVQLLLDGVVNYLPSPFERICKNVEFYDDKLCALLFKVIFDKQKGCLSYLRLYKGSLLQGQKIYNVNKDVTEKIAKLYTVYANEFKEIKNITEGNIVAVTGLNTSVTGDTIVADRISAKNALEKYNKIHDPRSTPPLLGNLLVPDPVFFCSIEPASLAHIKPLEFALECLQREDPSLQVKYDDDTGQKILKGMGELHINIIEDRIKKEHKADVYLGPLQVAYKETVHSFAVQTSEAERTIGDVKSHILIKLSVEPSSSTENKFELMRTGENKDNLAEIRRSHLQAIESGIKVGLQYGPILGSPVIQTLVGLHWVEIKRGSSPTVISALTSQCLLHALRSADPSLLEPIMFLEITTPGLYLHNLLGDLSQRRGQIIEIKSLHDLKIIHASVPLSELMGYSSVLRKISSGLANFTMEFKRYDLMTPNDQKEAIKRVTGFV